MSEVKNLTKNTILSKKCTRVTGLSDKILGLIGKPSDRSIFIEARFGVHTFGMTHPIDVAVLNGENRVITVKKNLRPRRFFLWNPKHRKILELPDGSLLKSKTEIGDNISF